MYVKFRSDVLDFIIYCQCTFVTRFSMITANTLLFLLLSVFKGLSKYTYNVMFIFCSFYFNKERLVVLASSNWSKLFIPMYLLETIRKYKSRCNPFIVSKFYLYEIISIKYYVLMQQLVRFAVILASAILNFLYVSFCTKELSVYCSFYSINVNEIRYLLF